MIFPCPALGPVFLTAFEEEIGSWGFLAVAAVGGRGSSSEKDSQAGSSLVTGVRGGEGLASLMRKRGEKDQVCRKQVRE